MDAACGEYHPGSLAETRACPKRYHSAAEFDVTLLLRRWKRGLSVLSP